MKPRLTRLILCVSMLAWSGLAGALSYSALPFEVKIVDAETGLPLEGVIGNALWRLEARGGRNLGNFVATEAVSDKDGMMRMPGWGPMEVPKEPGGYLAQGRLDPNQPTLQLYKQDYWFSLEGAPWESAYLNDPHWSGDSVRRVYLDKMVFKLKPFKGPMQQYTDHLIRSQNGGTNGCLWVNAPRMNAAFINEGRRLRQFDRSGLLITLKDIREYDHGKFCGSKDVLQQHLKP